MKDDINEEEEKDLLANWDKLFEKVYFEEVFKEKMDDHFESKKPELFYESIEDYTAKTGKRFRMNKEQKGRGLTREEAFNELFPQKDND